MYAAVRNKGNNKLPNFEQSYKEYRLFVSESQYMAKNPYQRVGLVHRTSSSSSLHRNAARYDKTVLNCSVGVIYIKLIELCHFLLKCLYQDMKVSSHVFV